MIIYSQREGETLKRKEKETMRDNVSYITYGADYITINRDTGSNWVKVSKVPVLTVEKDAEGGKTAAIAAEIIFRLRF